MRRHAAPDQGRDRRGHPGRLGLLVGVAGHRGSGPGGRCATSASPAGPAPRRGRGGLAADQPVRHAPPPAGSTGSRAPAGPSWPGVVGRERPQVLGRGPGERVDRLPRVADHAQLLPAAEPGVEQQLLQRVDVLELVHGEVPERGVHLAGRGGLGEQDRRGQLEHRLEVDQLPVPAQRLVRRVQPPGVLDAGRRGPPGLRRREHVGVGVDLADLRPLDLGHRLGAARRRPARSPRSARPPRAAAAASTPRSRGAPPADHPRPEVAELPQRRRVERGRPHRLRRRRRARAAARAVRPPPGR